ncbi:aldolase/citrate lyase family protein, partial [Acetomicrobium sp. S15 = DSM 107314]|uniref:aldolase/citrate lyase family protein n=1 Tax=Acetomicrobium sp. S15 = DSM 107314 TaxID=2529858 RepID=UPI00406D091C
MATPDPLCAPLWKVVRINDVSTPWWEADLIEVVPANPDVIRLPKVESTDD